MKKLWCLMLFILYGQSTLSGDLLKRTALRPFDPTTLSTIARIYNTTATATPEAQIEIARLAKELQALAERPPIKKSYYCTACNTDFREKKHAIIHAQKPDACLKRKKINYVLQHRSIPFSSSECPYCKFSFNTNRKMICHIALLKNCMDKVEAEYAALRQTPPAS